MPNNMQMMPGKKYAQPNGNMMPNKRAMMLELQQLSFSLVDLNLFLDTHPNDQEAIDDFNELFKQYWELKSNYELQFGPLNNFGHNPASCPWSWVDEPWPWEKGGNC